MKKLILVFIILLPVGYLIGEQKGLFMHEIRTEIEISAPNTKVWSVLTDVEKWENWSPIIKKSAGASTLGSKLDITMNGKDGKNGPRYMPVVTISEEPRLFRWRAKMMAEFLFTNDKVFEFEETSSGTRLIHRELFKGILVPVFCNKLDEGVPPMLNAMNEALKALVEGN